ncbi:MAG: LCP family protein [Bowdeniella nasicola]|nr:LCP family protein [Bowdeniella nasicola]
MGQAAHADERRMSNTKRALIVLLVIALILVGLVAGGLMFLRYKFDRQVQSADWFAEVNTSERPTMSPTDDSDPAVNFLILGADTEGSTNPDPNMRGQRSDVTMLVQLSGDRQKATVMSIPRDSWVPIPGHGHAKINAGLSYGGVPLAIQTVEGLTGVRIDHAVLVNFTSFSAITDALGGVTINSKAGEQRMDGQQALKFARTRTTLPRGDFDRVRRQQEWMRAMASEVFTRDVLTSPNKLYNVLDAITRHTTVDAGLTMQTMQDLALESRDIRPGDVRFITAPYTGTGWSSDGQSIVNLDHDVCNGLFAAWARGEAAEYIDDHPAAIPNLYDRPVD